MDLDDFVRNEEPESRVRNESMGIDGSHWKQTYFLPLPNHPPAQRRCLYDGSAREVVKQECEMQLTPALNEKVMKAVQTAVKDAKPRPAVDRLVAARTIGKWHAIASF
jgi:hypothetical protein